MIYYRFLIRVDGFIFNVTELVVRVSMHCLAQNKQNSHMIIISVTETPSS